MAAKNIEKLRATLRVAAAEILLRAGPAALVHHADEDDEGSLDLADPDSRPLALAILETTFLVVAVDGELTEAESLMVVEAIVAMTQGTLDRTRIERLISTFADVLAREGYRARIDRVAEALRPEPSACEAAYLMALSLLLDDAERTLADEERALLVALAHALGLDHDAARALLEQWFAQCLELTEEQARTQAGLWSLRNPEMPQRDADARIDAMSAAMTRRSLLPQS